MPELPEVETMVRGLRPVMAGRAIASATVLDPFLLHGATPSDFERQVGGSTVSRLERRGKWVVFVLEGDTGVVVIQPRMTGGFSLVEPARMGHVRLVFRLGGPDRTVWFFDPRRLGKIGWYDGAERAEAAFRKSHGPDALEIAAGDLADRLRRTGRPVKPALMDQKLLAGLGNIYADEVLFTSGIHPERPASTLGRAEVDRVHKAITAVLTRAIAAEGSSFDRHYRTVLGSEGGFLKVNAVYGRGGLDCTGGCGGLVLKTKIAGLIGRPTHYCPSCQPWKPARRRRR